MDLSPGLVWLLEMLRRVPALLQKHHGKHRHGTPTGGRAAQNGKIEAHTQANKPAAALDTGAFSRKKAQSEVSPGSCRSSDQPVAAH